MRKALGLAAIAAAIALSSSLVKADTTYTIGDTTTPCAGCKAADAVFSFGSGVLNLQLTNDEPDIGSAAQLLSAFSFVLSGASGGSLTSSSGDSITVASGGSFVDNGIISGVGWVPVISGSTYSLDVLSGVGHAGPANTIIGLPDSSGIYGSANGSIAGNGAHNPFLDGAVNFTFSIPGLNPDLVSVSSANFQFGTSDNHSSSGSQEIPSTPEPTTLILAGCGLLVIGLLRRKKLVKN